MPFYEIAFTTTATANGAPLAAIRAPTNTVRIWEIGWFCNAATVGQVTLFRNTNASYAASTSTSVGQAIDIACSHAATGLVDTAWSAAPTITSASRLRRAQAPAVIGAGIVWTWRTGLIVRTATATDNLVLWNESGGAISVLNGYVTFEE
jgi:hypothetical protein